MRLVLLLIAAVVSILSAVGCGTAHKPRSLSVAVAIAPIGGRLSAAQVVQIHQALRPEIESAGYIFAESNAAADLVLTVSFVPSLGSSGGRIKITSLEPTAEFRRSTEGGESAEAKQWRRLERELQSAVEANLKQVGILRRGAEGKSERIVIDVAAILNGSGEDPKLQKGDVIHVPEKIL